MADDFESFLRDNAQSGTAADGQNTTAVPVPPPSAPAASDDGSFEAFMRQAKGQSDAQTLRQAQGIAVANSDMSPDAAGRAAQVGRQIGAPQAAIETDLPRYEAQAKAQQNAQILAGSPKLAAWVASNPDSARVAQDDFSAMADGEQLLGIDMNDAGRAFVNGVKNSFVSAGLAMTRLGKLSVGEAQSDMGMTGQYSQQDIQGMSDAWYQHMIQPLEEQSKSLQLPQDAPFGVKAASFSGNLLGTLAQIIATGGASEGPAVAEGAGLLGRAAGVVAHGARAMMFPSLTSGINTASDVYDQTGSIKQAALAGQMSYLTTTLSGVVPMGLSGNLLTRAATGFVSGAGGGEFQRQAMNLVLPQHQDFDPQDLLLNGMAGVVLASTQGPRQVRDGVRQAFSDATAAETAERGGSAIEQVSQAAQASKLRTNDPAAFRQFMQTISEDGQLPHVYVDGQTFADALHQSSVDPANIPGLQDRLSEALNTGGDVQIPTADYATHIAGTDLEKAILPELKSEEGGMTYSEGQQFFQNATDDMNARAQDILGRQGDADAQQADLDKISDTLTGQIKDTDRYPPNVARASVAPVTEFYRTMAERLDMTPADLFEQYPLRIGTGASDVGQRLGQAEGWGSIGTDDPSSGLAYNPKGTFTPGTKTISLFEGANLSTLLHESGHFFLDSLAHMAGREDAPQQIKDDMQTFLTWAGGKDLADWNSRSINQQRDMHEKFARGFEQYLMDGKAPTTEMQPLFSRFRSWLMNVYRNFTELHGANPSPEMREVFDRMLASDNAIRRTEQIRGHFPIDVKAAGATDAQAADYARQGEAATQSAIDDMQKRSLRDMQWMSKAKAGVVKALQRQHDALRDQVREQVAYEVMDQPINLARQFLKTGESMDPRTGDRVNAEEGFKLNADAVKRMYAEDTYPPDLTKLRGLTAKGGMHPDDIADLFGFQSGDDLVRSLIDGEKPEKAIERLTDQRMLEQHGELTDPKAIEDAANLAVANHARARFMATGLKILSNSDIPANELAKAATEAAAKMIAGKRVRDLSPRQYEVAEAKANREAVAKAPTDPKAAVDAQRQALLSNRLARGAREALAEVDKIVTEQRQYDKPSIRKKMDLDILDQIDGLRERFDFRRSPPPEDRKTAQQTSLSNWIRSQQDLGYAPLVNQDMTNPAVRMPYRDMTVEQIRGFRDTIQSLETIARARKNVTVEGQQRDLASVVDELVAKMKEKPDQFSLDQLVERPRLGVDSPITVALDRISGFLRATAAELKPQQFKANAYDAQEVLGPFTKTIFDRVFSANYGKIDMLKGLSDYFGKAVTKKLGSEWQDRMTEEVPNRRLLDADLTKEHGAQVYRRLTRGDMLGIARHVGNESNFDKLTKGMDWDPRDVWLFLHDNMTEKDWQATQITWDAFEKHWPEMVEMNQRLGNTSPDRVEPRPFSTKFGDMKGGYAPIDYDPMRSRLGARKQDSAAIDPSEGLFGKGYYRADTTTNGSLNGRIEGYFDRINLDYHSLEKRLHDTVHDLAYREALIDVHKILMNRDFAKQFKLSNGQEQYKSMQRWLGNLANSQNMEGSSSKLVAIMSASRRMIVANGIALRISTVLKHGGSAALKSSGYFSGGGQKYFAARMVAIGANHTAEVQGAMAKFPEIRARLLQQDRDYRQTSSSLFHPESLHAKAERFGHSMVAWSDMMTAVPTAWAAYDRAITEGIPKNRGGTGQPMSEADAVKYANQIVREAHGSNIEASRSMILAERNEAIKMFTTLYGFMNNTLGQNMDMVNKLRTNGFSKPEILSRYLMAMIVPALWAGVLAKPDKNEGVAKWAAGAIGGEYASMVPMMRDAWSAIQGYSSAGMPAYMSALGAIAKPAQDVIKMVKGEPVKSPIKDLGNSIGLAIPGAGQIGTSLQYLADVHSGTAQPHSVSDVVRGVALGQSNK